LPDTFSAWQGKELHSKGFGLVPFYSSIFPSLSPALVFGPVFEAGAN